MEEEQGRVRERREQVRSRIRAKTVLAPAVNAVGGAMRWDGVFGADGVDGASAGADGEHQNPLAAGVARENQQLQRQGGVPDGATR